MADKSAILEISFIAGLFSSLYDKYIPVKQEAISALALIQTLHELYADIQLGAVQISIKLLKNSKGSGAHGIPVLKCGGEALAALLHAVVELWWRTHCLPHDFKDANIFTLHKNKGSRQDCKLSRNFATWWCWERFIPRVSSKAASNFRQRPAGESMWSPFMMLNH